MTKILLDTLGLDKGFKEVVKAGVNSLLENDNLEICFLGDEKNIKDELKTYEKKFEKKCGKKLFENIKIINAPTEISCNDIPTKAIKEKIDSSLVVGFNELKNGYDALISGGSTGAVLTGGFLKIGRIKGVSRPALCPMLPTIAGGKVMLIDCGANVDSKPNNLCDYALMADIYLKSVMGIENPKIALLNIGVEENKGNELTKETYKLLKQMPINFVGNLEAREFLSGEADVVITDAFSGNVLLKGTEGAISMVLKMLKTEIKKSFVCKIGALLMKKAFKHLKSKFKTDNYGGSILLGLKNTLIKVHGSSSHIAIEVAIKQAIDIKENKVLEKFEEEFSKQVENNLKDNVWWKNLKK